MPCAHSRVLPADRRRRAGQKTALVRIYGARDRPRASGAAERRAVQNGAKARTCVCVPWASLSAHLVAGADRRLQRWLLSALPGGRPARPRRISCRGGAGGGGGLSQCGRRWEVVCGGGGRAPPCAAPRGGACMTDASELLVRAGEASPPSAAPQGSPRRRGFTIYPCPASRHASSPPRPRRRRRQAPRDGRPAAAPHPEAGHFTCGVDP